MAKIATRGGDATRVIDTVGQEEATHEHVPQHWTVTPIRSQAAELLALLKEVTVNTSGFKVLIFFTTARLAGLYAELVTAIGGYTVLEMHSRKSQPHRTRVADQFRDGSNMVRHMTHPPIRRDHSCLIAEPYVVIAEIACG